MNVDDILEVMENIDAETVVGLPYLPGICLSVQDLSYMYTTVAPAHWQVMFHVNMFNAKRLITFIVLYTAFSRRKVVIK